MNTTTRIWMMDNCGEYINEIQSKFLAGSIFQLICIFTLAIIIIYVTIEYSRYRKFIEYKKLEKEFVEYKKIQKQL